jgi:hypothetical protein
MTGSLAVGGRIISPSGFAFSGGPGALTIGSGGTVQVGGDTVVLPQGKINLQGGSFYTNTIRFDSGSGGVFNWTSGTLHVGTYGGNLVNSAGVLSPGQSPGKTTINGTYTQQSAATLQIELAGTTSGTQFDFVNVTGIGNSTLGGSLQLSLLNNFVPAPTDTFTILSAAGNLLGSFANVTSGHRLTTTDGQGSFLVWYGTGSSFNPKQIVLLNFLAVPEPTTIALAALFVGAIASAWPSRHRI